jgi:hypothetical protein
MSHLIQRVVENGQRNFDVKSLFALSQTSLPQIQQLGMRALVKMSEISDKDAKNPYKQEAMRSIDAEFENYIPQLVDMSKSGSYNEEIKQNALLVLANLSLRDYLRPQILNHKGMELFL